jgi:membrane-associated phospholipid phosphatase
MDLHLLFDYIGLYAPIIQFILTLFLLRKMPIYLRVYVAGTILNNIINIILKLTLKEPRPNNEQKAIEIGVVNGARIGFDKFGMPSGHAQNCGYNLAFIILTLHNQFVTTLFAAITIISLLQRYLYKNHTVLQLIVGLFVGIGFGYVIYLIGSKYIMGNIKMKKDDGAPL